MNGWARVATKLRLAAVTPPPVPAMNFGIGCAQKGNRICACSIVCTLPSSWPVKMSHVFQ
ncbi:MULTISPECIES: hypothetical protein [Sorangium]|uniref:hypothetical protein n=1 Tax=Sorangium TaxID=39643 RepID=UPI003D9C5EA8